MINATKKDLTGAFHDCHNYFWKTREMTYCTEVDTEHMSFQQLYAVASLNEAAASNLALFYKYIGDYIQFSPSSNILSKHVLTSNTLFGLLDVLLLCDKKYYQQNLDPTLIREAVYELMYLKARLQHDNTSMIAPISNHLIFCLLQLGDIFNTEIAGNNEIVKLLKSHGILTNGTLPVSVHMLNHLSE